MNNDLRKYIKKKEKQVDKSSLIFIISAGILGALYFFLNINIVFLVLVLVVIIGVVSLITTRKENKEIRKYELGMDIDTNIYVRLVNDNEYLKEINDIIGNDVDKYKDLVDYIDKSIDNKEIVFLENNFDLQEATTLLNNLLKKKKIKFKLDYKKLISSDDDAIKARRSNKINTDLHDLAKIRYYLEENNLELIRFFAFNNDISKKTQIDGYLLTIVGIDKVEKLIKTDYKQIINYERKSDE